MKLEALRTHPFVRMATLDAVAVHKALGTGSAIKVEAAFSRDPDEAEFYLLRVGRGIAELLTCCDQISQAVEYLSHSPSTRLMSKGLDRHKHILYHIENHTIRTHSLYDRALQLIDAVFHLLNAATEISHKVVTANLKVARTDVPAKLKALRTILAPTFDVRHEVIHRESFKDDALRELEMYCVVEGFAKEEDSGPLKLSRVRARQSELAREVRKQRRKVFEAINAKLYKATYDLLSALEPIYRKEKALVALRA